MSWWNGISDWWNGEDEEEAQAAADAERAAQAAKWRQAVTPGALTPATVQRADPLEAALAQWRNTQAQPTATAQRTSTADILRPTATTAPMQGPLRPGEQRPMVPSVGPTVAPPSAPGDQWSAALDAWRAGPPQQQEAAKPWESLGQFDVEPSQADYALSRPDTGGSSFTGQQQAPTVSSPTAPYDPYAPQQEGDEWGITRFGGGNMGAANASLPMAAARYAYNQLPGASAWDKFGNLAGPVLNQFGQTAAGERFQYDMEQRNAAPNTDPTWGDLAQPFGEIEGVTDWQGIGGAALGAGMGALEKVSPEWLERGAGNVLSGLQWAQDSVNAIRADEIPVVSPLLEKAFSAVAWQKADIGNDPLGAYWETMLFAAGPAAVKEAFGSAMSGEQYPLQRAMIRYMVAAGEEIARQREAVTPDADQAASLTPVELRRAQDLAYLNFADPAAVAKTFDALVDQPAQVATYTQKAKEAMSQAERAATDEERDAYLIAAADYGAQAYELENTHPIALVNQNTNIWRQMAAELLQPDITDLAGGLLSLTGLTPKARRLGTAAGEVLDTTDETLIARLADMATTPETKAAILAERSDYNKVLNLWTTGQARAQQATNNLHTYVTNLLADVDTVGDAKLLLRQLAADPAKLISGMSANLFQSEGLLARAGSDNLVRFGGMGLDKIKEPLRIYQQMADEFLATAESLQRGVLLNKPDFAAEFLDATNSAGYRFYNVADAAGNAQTSTIGAIGSALRRTVSPFYIYLNPGGWATNYISGVVGAMGDGSFSTRLRSAIDGHLNKLFPVDPTVRGLEGATSGSTFAGQGLAGGIFGPLKKAYGQIDETVGRRVYYQAVTHALQKTGRDVLANTLTPILQGMGIADPKQARNIINHLYETGYSGGNLVEEFNKLTTGQARTFALSDVNPRWLDALPADSLTEFYDILRKAPDATAAQAQLTTWADKAAKYWDDLIQQSPVIPQRHAWMKQEVVQDTADLAQTGKMAEKYAGIPAAQVAEWKKAAAAAMQDTQRRMETLMNVVAESANPQNRYMLYNVWGQVSDMTAGVRQELGELAERAAMLPPAQRGQAWATYWDEARRVWDERNGRVNGLLEQAAGAVAKGEDFTPSIGQWDILERTAKANEQKLWDTLRLDPQSGAYDQRLTQVIDAGRQITDKAVARAYAAARRFAQVDAMDYIISAERNAQMAGAQARAYLDTVLDATLDSGKWEDYFSIRNETWRQLRQYERDVWGMAERSIVQDGLGVEKATGLKFNAGPDGVVELVSPTTATGQRTSRLGPQKEVTSQTYTDWIVRREDGSTTTIPDNMVPAELKQRYRGVTPADVETEIQTELDNIASAHPFADEAQQLLDAPAPPIRVVEPQAPGIKGTLRVNGKDTDVTILGAGENGAYRYQLPDGTVATASMESLMVTDAKGRRFNLRSIQQLRRAEGEIARAQDMIAGTTDARATLRAEWDRIAKAEGGYQSIDQLIATYTRQGIVNVPENKFEDLYGATVAGRRLENQEDVNRLLQEYYDLNQQAKSATAQRKVAQGDYDAALATAEQVEKKVKQELNLGNSAQVKDLQKTAAVTTRNATQAGGVQAPDIALAAMHAKEQLQNLLAHVYANLDNIMTPKGAIGEGQALRAMDDFRRTVLPAWDNVKQVAAKYGDKMRGFAMVDFTNNTRLDELASLVMPYSFWFTRAAKNSMERAIFEPHIWRRMMQANRDMEAMSQQQGDPARYEGLVPVDLGNGTTYYLRINPVKYWPTFGLFTHNDYADPESANNAFTFGVEALRSGSFSLYPWIDAASKAANGQWDEVKINSYFPQGRLLGWTAANLMGPNIPTWLRPAYYEYNVGRELTTMVTEGSITSEQAQYAQDILRTMRTGEEMLPEVQAQQETLGAILKTATERAAQKELISAGSSWATGVQVKPFDQDERAAMQATQRYADREYNPISNPYGGETAQAATFDQYPELSPRFSQSAILNEEKTRPGASAAKSELIATTKDARDTLYAAGDTALDTYLDANPAATKNEMYQARRAGVIENAAQFIDPAQLDAFLTSNPDATHSEVIKFVTDTLGQQYPSAELVQPSTGEKAYNPLEQKTNFQESTLKQAAQLFPYPEYPEGGTPAQIAAYMKQKEAVDAQRQAWTIEQLTTGGDQLMPNWMKGSTALDAPALATSPDEAQRLMQENRDQYKTEAEKQRLAEIEGERAAKSSEWQNRRAAVADYFGEGGAAMWDQYYALPKGEARKKFIEDNPVMRVLNLYAYNTTEMQQALDLFGAPAVHMWAAAPAYADTPEAKAARAKHWDDNPRAFLFSSWLNGRPATYKEGTEGTEGFTYNFGKDYAAAQEMFGEGIWDVVGQFKRGWNSAQRRLFYEKYPEYNAWADWWYGREPRQQSAGTGRAAGGGFGGYSRQEPAKRPLVVNQPNVYGQGLSAGLAEPPRTAGYAAPRIDTSWLQSGRELRPGKPREWSPDWIRGARK